MIETVQHGFIVVDSPRGNDSTAKRDSWSNPFATVSAAFREIRDYDTVLIYPGPYQETPLEPLDLSILAGGGAPLWLYNRRSVTIQGLGRPVIWFTAHGNGLCIDSCTDIRIEGLHLRGAGLLLEPKAYYFALLLCNGYNDHLQIRDCVFSESGDHGIAHLIGPRTTNNCIIENNHFTTGGNLNHPLLVRDGAAIALGGSGNLIYGNRIEFWLRGMEYESGSFPGQDAPTLRNIFSHNRLLQCYWQHMIITPTHLAGNLFDQLIIEGNLIQGWGEEPETSLGPANRFSHDGIYLAGGRNVQIRGNEISDMWDGSGMRITADWGDITDLLVSENRIWNVDRTGIHAQSVPAQGGNPAFDLKRCRFVNNQVGPCGGRGILVNGDYNVVESNDIHECGQGSELWEGVYIEGGRRNSVRQNRVIDCLPVADKGIETSAGDNDHFWETRKPV
jgi:hypothetical protein